MKSTTPRNPATRIQTNHSFVLDLMGTVLNKQSRIPLNVKRFEAFAALAVRAIPETRNIPPFITFVDDEEMRRLNRDYRGTDSTTDVLSFGYNAEKFEVADSLGDIVISAEQASRQALENGFDLDHEIVQLILHGILHLCGYDHETDSGEMDARETELRETLEII